MMIDTMTQFSEAIRLAGLRPPETILDDGQLHRFPTSDKPGDKAGWYILYGDGVPAGSFGDWRTGIQHTWHADIGRNLSDSETLEHQKKIDTMRRVREAENERKHDNACNQAESIWNTATPAPANHPYLVNKGIQAYGLREHDGALVIPVQTNGVRQSLQFIETSGNKRFLCGGKVRGGYFSIGNPKDIICICEGYATGASIFAATGYAVAVAFGAGNLGAVAKVLRKKFQDCQLILCADDDIWTNGNPGLSKAREAASSVNGLLAIPNFGENRQQGMTDFNDVHRYCGIDVVKRSIDSVKPINKLTVKLIHATDVKPKAVVWLWPNWLASGNLHIIAGAPGTGKTTIALNLAAIISNGGQWPDGTRCESPGNVLIWSGEDDVEHALLPRLYAHGADPKQIYFISAVEGNNASRAFDPSQDMPKLYKKAAEIGNVRLIIIDPIVNAVSGDSHKNGEVRRSLQPLVELGEKLNAVILGISHFSKGTMGRDPLERVTGSIAFSALARIVLATAKFTDPTGQTKRVLVRAKSNYGPDGDGFNYQIEQRELVDYPGVFSSRVIWDSPLKGSARELLTDPNDSGTPEEHSALAEAIDFLNVLLEEGFMNKKIIIEKAKEAGVNYSTLHRAKKFLGIEAIREGFGEGGVWKWRLPPKEIKNLKEDHLPRVNAFENNEQLLLDLTQMHPAMVEGCKLSDILHHAIPKDYEALKDPATLGCWARWLRDTGKIKPCN